MAALNLSTSATALLTRTDVVPDPNNPGKTISTSYPCDVEGNRLAAGVSSLPLFQNVFDGKFYVKVCEVIPSDNDAVSVQRRKELQALNPIHYAAPDGGSSTGYYVPAPDFNKRDSQTASVAEVPEIEPVAEVPAAGTATSIFADRTAQG